MGHTSQQGYDYLSWAIDWTTVAMYIFFAMSGFGLVISYLKNKQYINGFLKKSLTKLFVPYLIALVLYVLYRWAEGIDQVELFRSEGLYSFVPTSWYIWVLSYFYVFFYVTFKYIKSSNLIKVLTLCALVMAYVIIAPHIGISPWRYLRCPAFCVGAFCALYDEIIRAYFKRWHVLLALGLLCIFFMQPHLRYLDPLCSAATIFLVMYLLPPLKEFRIVRFLSSISLEMFIIQFLPIYFCMNVLGITNTAIMIPSVLTLDILLAHLMHKLIKRIRL